MNFDFSQDPLVLFEREIKKAVDLKLPEPTAFSLSTIGQDGFPSVRTLLFKGLSEGGLTFFTNYNSTKGQELLSGKAAMLFFWPTLAEQIRIQGAVEKLDRAASEAYFKTRPRLSQIGAWASEQSQEIPGPEYLQARVAEIEKRFHGQDVPCPPHWGGFRLTPMMIEFWFGREGRLHDRYVFERAQATQSWRRYMKSP